MKRITGSISHGTMREEDLIPAFEGALDCLGIAYNAEYDPDDMEDQSWYCWEHLVELLDSAAPNGYYFGSHPGDGSDYGFWENEEE